ncbi:hypothetical protein ACKKBG_A23170 [Auxenochlorella protothecoides x Auxenochlorella symbiontica]|uniref:MaoC-like domain-containing protein n=1 Tax=Auxenochlorella protothecoides TaxID=3075 RepID=A0A1D1ZM94_AUXPR
MWQRRLCGLVGHARGAQARRLATGAGPDLGLGATLQRAVAFGPSEVAAFVRLTGDTNPIHQSLPAAQAAGFERCLVPGIMAASLFPALIGSAVPGALYLTQTLKFRAPVQVSEPMLASVTVSRISGRRLTFDTQLTDSAGAVRVSGSALAMLPPST